MRTEKAGQPMEVHIHPDDARALGLLIDEADSTVYVGAPALLEYGHPKARRPHPYLRPKRASDA